MDTQIAAFFTSYDATWSRHDAAAFTNHFLENASAQFHALDGKKTELNSRAEMPAFYTPSFKSLQSRPTVGHITEINRMQNLLSNLMLADGDALITEQNAEGATVTIRKWAVSFVLQQLESGWKILSLRASDRPLT
ncbi:MAG: nuclear transport factor 2 family protein [Chloroflexi bacterium]|nr:nuclear transport factor 2 family protein [Chloroflexota bacterium]